MSLWPKRVGDVFQRRAVLLVDSWRKLCRNLCGCSRSTSGVFASTLFSRLFHCWASGFFPVFCPQNKSRPFFPALSAYATNALYNRLDIGTVRVLLSCPVFQRLDVDLSGSKIAILPCLSGKHSVTRNPASCISKNLHTVVSGSWSMKVPPRTPH